MEGGGHGAGAREHCQMRASDFWAMLTMFEHLVMPIFETVPRVCRLRRRQWKCYFSCGRAELMTDDDKQTLFRAMQAGNWCTSTTRRSAVPEPDACSHQRGATLLDLRVGTFMEEVVLADPLDHGQKTSHPESPGSEVSVSLASSGWIGIIYWRKHQNASYVRSRWE